MGTIDDTHETSADSLADEIEPGMTVEASAGDLGEEDVSKPRVKEVVRNAEGAVEKVVVTKGILFKKTLDVPIDRVKTVESAPASPRQKKEVLPHPDEDSATTTPAMDPQEVKPPLAETGHVILATSAEEIEALSSQGTEELSEREVDNPGRLLAQVEEALPTTEGLRGLEARQATVRRRETRFPRSRTSGPTTVHAPTAPTSIEGTINTRGTTSPPEKPAKNTDHSSVDMLATSSTASPSAPSPVGTSPTAAFSLRELGPGLLAGMAGNDASAVTSYSINGATNGYGQLWLLVLATPLYQAVQYTCARIGRVTQQGLAEVLRDHYGRKVAVPASLMLIAANTALIAADLVAIGTGLQLFTGLAWQWFVVPVAVLLWYLTVYRSFGTIKKIFLGMSLAFVAYLVTGLFSGANWGLVLKGTFVPQLSFGFAGISSAVALLGATVSPYTMYWQVQGEKEQARDGKPNQQLRAAAWDIASGTISGNLVAYAIVLCTSATLFTHHQSVSTAADAARALEPLLGPYAKYLFALGFIGAGLVAIPVLLASTSYAVSGTFGWPASLWKKPWQNEGFYLILTGALVVSLILALLGLDPIHLMFWANVLQGVLSPVLVILLLVVGNNRTIMRSYRLGRLTNLGLVLIALLMSVAAILLFYGLLTGQGG